MALRAQKVDSSYEALKTIRETLNQTTQLRDKAARDKPVAEEALKAAQAASDSSKTRWDEAENTRQSAMPIISDVRLRDAAIKKQSIDLEELKKEVELLQESINQSLSGLKEETRLLEQYLKSHAGEKVLVSAYSGLEASRDHLKEIEDEIKRLQKDDQKSKNREKELQAQLEKETQDLKALRSIAEHLKNQQEKVTEELKGVLQ